MRQGWDLRWLTPAEGEALPAMTDEEAATIVFGGKYDVREQETYPFLKDELKWVEQGLERGIPVLGLCLGAQLMAHVLGEEVGPHPEGYAEYGYYPLQPTTEGRSLLGDGLVALQSHWHGWYRTPRGAVALARSERFPEQAFRYEANAYAFQFHPEASLAALTRWAGRRGKRNFMPGAFPPERQIGDHALYDKALGDWFEAFLARWIVPAAGVREAAE
jgi:GMP synthase (glutamine-hydrolysing)